MAKAFYKKAQMAYENENYREAINLIIETKNNLNGNTNPDIIYLEAKARYKNDMNINKAKSLFQSFLNEADEDDGRIQEVAGILVDLETSEEFYSNGLRKQVTQQFSDTGRTFIDYYSECYEDTGTYKRYVPETSKYYGRQEYVVGALTVFEESFSDGEIYSQTYYKNVEKNKYQLNPVPYYKAYRNPDEDIKTIKTAIAISGGSLNCEEEKYTFNRLVSQGPHSFKFYNDEGKMIIHKKPGSIHVFDPNNEEQVFGTATSWDSITYYDFETDIDLVENFNQGMIKSFKEQRGKEHHIYHFNQQGVLTKRDFYKKNKFKYSEAFDYSNKSWTKI
ncbi:hypothetical protein KH5_23540 [Urechidicola sp. KH5]